ncbi:hypothetical protein ACJMK2_008819 [Sinanodonta woodiana]|uniref:Uncharacterized protein n=1 Tax=Sinanodonta woodiana TaxID=1069815 RepID=A0ABD3VQQ9_SINWO
MEVIPARLRAIFGVGLKEATNWRLRAANMRTTLLLVWEEEDKEELPVNPKYRENMRRKQRKRETEPRHCIHTPHHQISARKRPSLHLRRHTLYKGMK